MLYTTHMVTSLLAGTVLDKTLDLNGGIPYYVGVAIGSLLPDIDHPQSFIGRRSFGLATLINKWFGHRGATHTLLSSLLIGGVSFFILPANWAVGLSLGYISHILGDFFSKSGVPLLKPFKDKKYKLPLYKTGSLSESFILICSGLLLVYLTLL
jgi:inner membrane protein